MYMCVQMHVCTCVCHSWMNIPPRLIIEIGSLTEAGAHVSARQIAQKSRNYLPVPNTHTSSTPALRLEACTTMPGASVSAGDLNSGPQVCTTSTLPTRLSSP